MLTNCHGIALDVCHPRLPSMALFTPIRVISRQSLWSRVTRKRIYRSHSVKYFARHVV